MKASGTNIRTAYSILASCSLSATINKLSRFMDDFARPRCTSSRFTRGNVRNLMKRNAENLMSGGKAGKEKKALRARRRRFPVKSDRRAHPLFNGGRLAKESKGGRPAVSVTALRDR